MIIQCPNCRSVRVGANHYGRKVCGTAGTAVGTAGGVAAATSGARVGASLGVVAGPAGTLAGELAGPTRCLYPHGLPLKNSITPIVDQSHPFPA